MTPGKLLAELFRRGVQVEADGDRLRFSPRSRVTPELAELLKTHKAELLKTLGRVLYPATAENPPTAEAESNAEASEWIDGDELPDLEPCPKCDSLELWQSAGLGSHWRCGDCDPPTTALRLLEHAEQIRQRSPRPTKSTFARTSPGTRSQPGSTNESPTASSP